MQTGGDVPEGHHATRRLALDFDRVSPDFGPKSRTVPAVEQLSRSINLLMGQKTLPNRALFGRKMGTVGPGMVTEPVGVFAQQFFIAIVAQQAHSGRVSEGETAGLVQSVNGFGGRVQQGA